VPVTPRASRARHVVDRDRLRAHVTASPEAGKANEAERVLLARALGVPKSRLNLVRGQRARDKTFEVL